MVIPTAPSRLPQFLEQLGWAFTPSRLEETMGETFPWLDGYDHYDRARCMQNGKDLCRRLGVAQPTAAQWDAGARAGFLRYGPAYVIPNNGSSAWHAYARGAGRYYAETQDPRALQVVTIQNPHPDMQTLVEWYVNIGASREIAFMLDDALVAEMVGLGENVDIHAIANITLGHLRQWANPGWGVSCKPFMVGLTATALIAYCERYPDTRAAIQQAISDVSEWLWNNTWTPDPATGGSFLYQNMNPLTDMLPKTGLAVQSGTDARTFQGPSSLSDKDDDYLNCHVMFTTGVGADKQRYDNAGPDRVIAYNGATKTFTLSERRHPVSTVAAGDLFTLSGIIDADGGPGAAPDLNHLISPQFAWLYAQTGLAKWRERHDAIFDGGAMCWAAPWQGKQYNQGLYSAPLGLVWREAGVAKETPLPTLNLPISIRIDADAQGRVTIQIGKP